MTSSCSKRRPGVTGHLSSGVRSRASPIGISGLPSIGPQESSDDQPSLSFDLDGPWTGFFRQLGFDFAALS
jgi:hypothetical protein